ncbi:hypothetical protein, partial [Escherichia coli]|uniref:hypothetical protein n=1 Tax=Escherichia coli TaxID=562 RepID=UPI001F1109BD
HTNRPLTDFGGKTSIFSHPVYLFLREFSLQDFRGGSNWSALLPALNTISICYLLTLNTPAVGLPALC